MLPPMHHQTSELELHPCLLIGSRPSAQLFVGYDDFSFAVYQL